MTNQIIKPLYYSISPITSIIDERQKFNEISELKNIGVPAIYLGNSTGALNDTLIAFIVNNIKYRGALVITINGHCIDTNGVYSGRFLDNEFKESFVWDIEKLWNGHLYFNGLKNILMEFWKDKPTYIVFTQCIGDNNIFLNEIKEKIDFPSNIHIVALGGSLETDITRQAQLSKWLSTQFKDAVVDTTIEGIQSPTIATKLQISNNPNYHQEFQRQFEIISQRNNKASELIENKIKSINY